MIITYTATRNIIEEPVKKTEIENLQKFPVFFFMCSSICKIEPLK